MKTIMLFLTLAVASPAFAGNVHLVSRTVKVSAKVVAKTSKVTYKVAKFSAKQVF